MRRYNWRRDLADHRDLAYLPPLMLNAQQSLPEAVDLRAKCPPIVDQGDIGSCTANALAGAYGFLEQKFDPYSRLFIYYFERALEGDLTQDGGAQIRDGIKVLNKQGVCFEQTWPYDSYIYSKPTPEAVSEAENHKISSYERINNNNIFDLKACLSEGLPFVFGFSVFESFEGRGTAKTGIVAMPAKHESMVGGHAVMCVGYDDAKEMFIVRNSWGVGWGLFGYCFMPYTYLTGELASDFWVIKK